MSEADPPSGVDTPRSKDMVEISRISMSAIFSETWLLDAQTGQKLPTGEPYFAMLVTFIGFETLSNWA